MCAESRTVELAGLEHRKGGAFCLPERHYSWNFDRTYLHDESDPPGEVNRVGEVVCWPVEMRAVQRAKEPGLRFLND